MEGMSRETGFRLNDLEHLKQSIIDILTTPVGSRVMCRDYGSRLFQLTDHPINRSFFSKVYAAVAEALEKWEPRFSVEKITIVSIKEGHVVLSLVGKYLITQEKIILNEVVV